MANFRGKNNITVSLFEAEEKLDSGKIYLKDVIKLNGNELNEEIKKYQGNITNQLILRFLNLYPNIEGKEQKGKETFTKKNTE